MNKKIIWISIAVVVLVIVLYFVYKYYNKAEAVVIEQKPSPRSVGSVNSLSGLVMTV